MGEWVEDEPGGESDLDVAGIPSVRRRRRLGTSWLTMRYCWASKKDPSCLAWRGRRSAWHPLRSGLDRARFGPIVRPAAAPIIAAEPA